MKWYHISDTWTGDTIDIDPRRCTRMDDPTDDMTPCICVAPSVAQCFVGIGYWSDYSKFLIYETEGEPVPTEWVFDYEITSEHRFYDRKTFRRVASYTNADLVALGIPSLKWWYKSDPEPWRESAHVLIEAIKRNKIGESHEQGVGKSGTANPRS